MLWLSLAVIFHLLGIISSINAVMATRTSQGAIAWVIFLLSFPYIAVPAYWIFGRSRFNGYSVSRHSNDVHVMEKMNTILKELKPYCVPDSEITSAGVAAKKLASIPILKGNHVQLLIDGDRTFKSILEGIDRAENYILFQFFIIHDDNIGKKVQKHLIAKAKEGVKIYFLYDEIGCHTLPDLYKNELRDAGVQVYNFHTRKGYRNHFQLNFRNHRKIVVVDGNSAWIGGHNVGDEYLGKDPKFGHWRDTHIKIKGPAVLACQISFIEDWHWATNNILLNLKWTPQLAKEASYKVLIVPSGPADELETATLMFHHAINTAQKRIWIASPYFVPDDIIMSALHLAGLRGVDVRILIPDKPDHLLVYLTAFSYFKNASLTGVRFFRYTKGFLHQKVVLIDDISAMVGTANFDNRSFRLNFEITCIVANPIFVTEVEQMLTDDLANAREMTKDDIDNKSFWFKLSTRLARLTSPIQ